MVYMRSKLNSLPPALAFNHVRFFTKDGATYELSGWRGRQLRETIAESDRSSEPIGQPRYPSLAGIHDGERLWQNRLRIAYARLHGKNWSDWHGPLTADAKSNPHGGERPNGLTGLRAS